ncbi:MAG: hypothetical protein M1483_00260 [Actinobacteria bacterium]|nr:hypothetical protein [Actinomycetota bacterium]MCL6104070.1 hypothetical protein [Actinomycetota bacterium]
MLYDDKLLACLSQALRNVTPVYIPGSLLHTDESTPTSHCTYARVVAKQVGSRTITGILGLFDVMWAPPPCVGTDNEYHA